jgi:DNA replication initiation complex subunit (GINS family)
MSFIPSFQEIRDEIAFLDAAALSVLPTVVAAMPATDRNVSTQMERAAAVAYDIAERMLVEKHRRQHERLEAGKVRRPA